ncbi:MAG: acyl-CoA dehydrogenase [Burkholderiales bacterium]|nr:acyl-CoA dehydrogenase [Burkholderiales bacterium]
MRFEPNDDQRAFLDAVGKLVERQRAEPPVPERLQYSSGLEHALEEAGFFECMAIDELGSVAAASLVMELARLPQCAETVASALVAPWLCPTLPRPHALVWERSDAPVRFLPVAQTVIRIRDGQVEAARITPADVKPVDSLFAYPMGALRSPESLTWEPLPGADIARLRNAWRVGIAAEIAGCLDAALDSVLEHVKERRQFGRPLGAFQAVAQRLAECATLVEGAKWLALHAASSGTTLDAAAAAAYAQDVATRVAYDLHQFMGAMGLTLEHPLHRWTYRTKLLRSELGGPERQFVSAAQAAWPQQQEGCVS